MPPKKQSKAKTVRCHHDQLTPGSCVRGANCRFLHVAATNPRPAVVAAPVSPVPASETIVHESKPFGFGNFDAERYREAAMRVAKRKIATSHDLSQLKSYLREFWETAVSNVYPSSFDAALSQFQQIHVDKFFMEHVVWSEPTARALLSPAELESVLSELLLQRDFGLGLLGHSESISSSSIKFLALDATFLRSIRSLLACQTILPLQPTSCLPSVIRNLIASEPLFLEIIMQLIQTLQDEQYSGVPERITQGAHLCHILQHSFGFETQDLKPLYGRLICNPLSFLGGQSHSGEWRAVMECPPQRYNVRGELQGRIKKFCSVDEVDEGIKCMHRELGPDHGVIRHDHWSCCGGTDQFGASCPNFTTSTKICLVGIQCDLFHQLSINICLSSSDSPSYQRNCIKCGFACFDASCISTYCSMCEQSICLSCCEIMNKGSKFCAPFAVKLAVMNPAVCSFIDDFYNGAGKLFTRLLCDAIDNQCIHPRDVHIIHLLVASLDVLSRIPIGNVHPDDDCKCSFLAVAVAAVLARQSPFSYPNFDIPIDLRIQRRANNQTSASYVEHLRKFICQTKRFRKFADAMITSILAIYPTSNDLLSLINGDRKRLSIALEAARFECKYRASKSKSSMLTQLLEMGCRPRKYAVKAVLKCSRSEDAVNYFFSESKIVGDFDKSIDADLCGISALLEALSSLNASESGLLHKNSDCKESFVIMSQQQMSEFKTKVNVTKLLGTITSSFSILERFYDLKVLFSPLLIGIHKQVSAIMQQQVDAVQSTAESCESERRQCILSLLQRCGHNEASFSLRCFSGHPLTQDICLIHRSCSRCHIPLPASSQFLSCKKSPHIGTLSDKRCDFGICSACAKDQTKVQNALFSQFEVDSSICNLERLVLDGKVHESARIAFGTISSSSELAFPPNIVFGWKVPDLPVCAVPSGDICSPCCSEMHKDDATICKRCDRRFSDHNGHLCNDGECGVFVSCATNDNKQGPKVVGSPGFQEICMRPSSDRPICLVHSDRCLSGRKWTCTLASKGESCRNTGIGLCDSDVITQYLNADFKGLGTRAIGFSIGIYDDGVLINDRMLPHPIKYRSGEAITLEYDEPGRKLDVIINLKVVYSRGGLPPNLLFAITSGDKNSKFAALNCRQIDAPVSFDTHHFFLLNGIFKQIENTKIWNANNFFPLLSLLSAIRAKNHYSLCFQYLRLLQNALICSISKLIESEELNSITSLTGACNWIFEELSHAIESNRKSLLSSCVIQIKRVSIELLQGRNKLTVDSLSFLSKTFALCSKGFAQTTALAFDYLVNSIPSLVVSQSIVDYVSIPRWVIESIDPSRSFLSIYSIFGVPFPAIIHSGWCDLQKSDGSSVRLSCEAVQLLFHKYIFKDSDHSDTPVPVLTVSGVSESAEHELLINGFIETHRETDVAQSPLQTSSLPSSIHIGPSCISAVSWFKSNLLFQEWRNEIDALNSCCLDTRCSPAVAQSVITDLVRRGYVLRSRGLIALAGSPVVNTSQSLSIDSKPPKIVLDELDATFKAAFDDVTQIQDSLVDIFCKFQCIHQIPIEDAPQTLKSGQLSTGVPKFDSFKVLHMVFFTIEDCANPSPWSSSISSSSSVTVKEFESDLASTLDGLQKLHDCDDILETAREFEESCGSITSVVFKHVDLAPCSIASTSNLYTSGLCPICIDSDELKLIVSPCGHSACRNCFRELIRTAISDSGSPMIAKGFENLLSITAIKCMGTGCQEYLSLSFLQTHFPDLAVITHRMLAHTLIRNLNNSSCPISLCLCGQSILIGTSQDCEAICCQCGRFATISDFKRKEIPESWMPHASLSSDEISNWMMLNEVGNSDRRDLMRFKSCPHCGTMTTRCGCDPGKIECDHLERCPNEKCDHIGCTVCKKLWCWVCCGPNCPTKCSQPAVKRTHRKEIFLSSQNAISNLSRSRIRIDEQHIFLRARSEFLKRFFRGSDFSSHSVSPQQLVECFKCDSDTFRFLLFDQMLLKSKKHVTLLWLAFSVQSGSHLNFSSCKASSSSPNAKMPSGASIIQTLKGCNSLQTFIGRLYGSLVHSQGTAEVSAFDPSSSNKELVFADRNCTVTRLGGISNFPLVRAPIFRGPVFDPTAAISFTISLDCAPNTTNSTSFGIAAKTTDVQGSLGIGPTLTSWGIICTMGNTRCETKVVASGHIVAKWRMLEAGDILQAHFLDGTLTISLNYFECEHTFKLPPEVSARFGVSSNSDEDDFTFAMTLASNHCARILQLQVN